MRRIKNHRPSAALVVSVIARFLALSGTSYSAVTKMLPKNSVGSAQVINGSLRKVDLAKTTINALKENRGLKGTAGPAGPAGTQGATGAPGAQGLQGDPGPSTSTSSPRRSTHSSSASAAWLQTPTVRSQRVQPRAPAFAF